MTNMKEWTIRLADKLFQPILLRMVKEYQSIDGWLSPREATTLFLLARITRANATVVEIGSWKGKSTYCLAKGLGGTGRLIAIDPFDASGEVGSVEEYKTKSGKKDLCSQFEENLSIRGVLNVVETWKRYSKDFVGEVPEIDVLFIDGDHSIEGCKFDYKNYAPHVKSGGLIAFHDYRPSREGLGPTWVVENLLTSSDQIRFIGCFDSLWVGQRC